MIDCRTSTCEGTINNPYAIAFYNDWAYIASLGSSSIVICTNPTDLTGCTVHSGFSSPSSIGFYNDWAYITSPGSNTVIVCTDPLTLDLATCTSYSGQGTFQYPIATAFYNGHSYTSANSAGAVAKCQDATDLSTNCVTIPNFPSPYGLAFYP